MKLEDIARISAGGTPKRSEPNYWKDGDIPWVKISDIKSKYVSETEECITEQGLEKSSAKLFPKGTILYTIFATLGECAILDIDATTNQAIAGINVTSSKVLTDYLYYYLKSIKSKVVNKGRGVAQNNINLSILRKIVVPVPSIKMQRKIINILKINEDIILKRQQQIEALTELKKSVFLEMFGDPQLNTKKWTVGKIGDLTRKTQYGTSKKASETDGAYPVLRMNNITYDGDMDLSDLKYVDLTVAEKEKYLVYPGELLFNRTNSRELVGKTAVYNEKTPVAFAGYLVKLIPNDKANSFFISGYLNSRYGKRYLYNLAKNSIGMSNINATELKNIPIYIPPIDIQNKYKSKIILINEKLELLKKGLKYFELLYQSLLHKSFNGELFQKESIIV